MKSTLFKTLLACTLTVLPTSGIAGSWAMLFYKNNHSVAVDCWVNGAYQGVIAPGTTKYMPSEGFVTADSRWNTDGTLTQKQFYGGWSPTSPAEVVTVAVTRIGEPVLFWKGTFTSAVSGGYLKVHNGDDEIDAIDVEFAKGMPRGEPKILALTIGLDKKFEAKPELDGGSNSGEAFAAMEEKEKEIDPSVVFKDLVKAAPPYTIGIRRVSDEVYVVRLFDDGKEVRKETFIAETDLNLLFVKDYIPKGKVTLLVTWTADRLGGSPPEYSNIWINVNGVEYPYDQKTGLDWNDGRYGKSIQMNLKAP